jgi:hypothetical protein
MASEKLEAARRTGSLTNVIGALREEARTDLANAAPPAREQLDVVDGALRLANHLASQGTKGAERRQAMSGVQPGTTVTARGAAKTLLTREQKLERVKAWAAPMSEDQREAFIVSEKFDKLSDRQQEIISEVFSEIADKAYSDSVGIADYDFDQPSVDVDALTADEDTEDEVADDDYEAMFNQVEWEAEGAS